MLSYLSEKSRNHSLHSSHPLITPDCTHLCSDHLHLPIPKSSHQSDCLTHSLTLTRWLTHSLTHTLALTHSSHTHTHTHTHTLAPLTELLTHWRLTHSSLTLSLTHTLIHTIPHTTHHSHCLTHLLTHWLTDWLTHSLTYTHTQRLTDWFKNLVPYRAPLKKINSIVLYCSEAGLTVSCKPLYKFWSQVPDEPLI